MTSAADVALAVAAGADAVGIIVAPSARRVPIENAGSIAAAIPPFVAKIAVLAGQSSEEAAWLRRLGFTLQFSGSESAAECVDLSGGEPYIKVFHVDPSQALDMSQCEAYTGATWMFDTRVSGKAGGTGISFDWGIVEAIARARPIIVSGGLHSENVAECVRSLRPFAVDVRSGIETADRKDPQKMESFVAAVLSARG